MPTTRYSVPQKRCAKCQAPMHPSQEGDTCEQCKNASKSTDESCKGQSEKKESQDK